MKKKLLLVVFTMMMVWGKYGVAQALPMVYTWEGSIEQSIHTEWEIGDSINVRLVMDIDGVDYGNFGVWLEYAQIGDDCYSGWLGVGFVDVAPYRDTLVYFPDLFYINPMHIGGEWEVGEESDLVPHPLDTSILTYGYITLTSIEPSQPVPEPATLLLLGSGLIGFVVNKKRKKS